MKRQWINEELVEHEILSITELELIGISKTDHKLLGAAVPMKYFQPYCYLAPFCRRSMK